MDNLTWDQMLKLLLAGNPTQPADGTYPGFTMPAAQPVPALAADQPAYYADWRDFLEQRRQFQQQSAESQRQFNADLVANLARDQENMRRYEKDFGAAAQQRNWEQAYIPKRDAWSIAGASVLPNIRFLTR